MAALLLMGTTTMAQNGTYKVTNKHELTTTVLEERLSSSQYNITPEKPGTSLSLVRKATQSARMPSVRSKAAAHNGRYSAKTTWLSGFTTSRMADTPLLYPKWNALNYEKSNNL